MKKAADRHEDIKATLRLRGTNLASIARDLGTSINAVSLVAQGRSRSRRIAEEIAARAGLSAHQIWPEHYSTGEFGGKAVPMV